MNDKPNLMMISVDALIPTPDNPRHVRTDTPDFLELVESIKHLGVLQPVVARPMHDGTRFDLRAGHRRREAAKAAGLTHVPTIVREMDDKTAMDVTVAENLQRSDLTPLEESVGIQNLLRVGWQPNEIADRLGKPVGWVARRAKLTDLCDAWRTALEKPDSQVYPWPATLLERIARLAHGSQLAALALTRNDYWYRGAIPTVKELDKEIAAGILGTLHGAAWQLDDATLVPEAGACTDCEKRSACQPLLFDDLPDEGGKKRKRGGAGTDHCLDAECYERKSAAFVQRRWAEAKADNKGLLAIVGDGASYDEQLDASRALNVDVKSHYDLVPAKADEKGAVPALIVCGRGAGTLRWVKQGYTYTSSHATTPDAKPAKPAAETREIRRKALVLKQIARAFDEYEDSGVVDALHANISDAALANVFGNGYRLNDEINAWERHLAAQRKLQAGERERELIIACLPQMARLVRAHTHDMVAARYANAKPLCKLCGLDLVVMERNALAEIPEPAGVKKDSKPSTKKGKKNGNAPF